MGTMLNDLGFIIYSWVRLGLVQVGMLLVYPLPRKIFDGYARWVLEDTNNIMERYQIMENDAIEREAKRQRDK